MKRLSLLLSKNRRRLVALGCLAAVSLLGVACDRDRGRHDRDDRREALGESACSPDGAVTRDELLAGAPPICERQVLVSSLRPRDDYAIALRITSDAPMEYCFEDDNAEGHRATLTRDGQTVVDLTAGGACAQRHLRPGVYQLRLQHALRGDGADSTPDTIHARVTQRSDGARRFVVSSNECRGCDLKNKVWPQLSPEPSWGTYGYEGDYAGAHFDGSVCKAPVDNHQIRCVLGADTPSSFEGATFDGTSFNATSACFLDFGAPPDSPLTSFRGTSWKEVKYQSGSRVICQLRMRGDYSAATWTGSRFSRVELRGVLKGTLPTGFERATVHETELDVPAFRQLLALAPVSLSDNKISVERGDDLSGVTLDNHNSYLWPESNGKLAVPGMRFDGAHLSNIVFPCVDGGDMSGTSFRKATLESVTFSKCNLGKAHFDGAVLRSVVARDASLVDAELSGLTVDGLDISGSAVHGALTLADATVALRLVARDITGALVANDLKAVKADFFHTTLSDSRFVNAQLVGADFATSTLDRVDFSGATLDDASFTRAKGAATIFQGALLRGATTLLDGARFTAATFDSARLDGAKFRSGRVCGGSTRGLVLDGADLGDTLVPRVANTYTVDGVTFDCQGVSGRDAITTSGLTKCPDGRAGPCASDPRWIPDGYDGVCCDPWDPTTWTGASCDRSLAGQACNTNCDCASLRCTAKQCG